MIPVILISLALFIAPLLAAIPDEPSYPQAILWTAVVVALLLAAGAWSLFSTPRAQSEPTAATRRPAVLFGAFCAWSAICLLWQWLAVHHGGPAYLDQMIRTLCYWLSGAALIALLPRLCQNRAHAYIPVIATLASATIVAMLGIAEYVPHLFAHEASWRVFATSTPDFLAGFLVMTIPITLALFLGCARISASIAYAASLLLQAFVLLTTGSRFGLISLAIGIIVFIICAAMSRKRGFVFGPSTRMKVIVLLVLIVLSGAVAAKPIIARLGRTAAAEQAHSGQFRVWTYRGSFHAAKANPIFGTGPGTFIFSYQKYALVGYTRLAHDSYLQTAVETGFVGLAFIIAALASVKLVGWRAICAPATADCDGAPTSSAAIAPRIDDHTVRLKSDSAPQRKRQQRRPAPPPQEPKDTPAALRIIDAITPDNDRWALCGLMGAFAAGLVQNIVDSTWYVTFDGIALWAVGGLIVGFAASRETQSEPKTTSPVLAGLQLAGRAILAAGALTMAIWGAAEAQAQAGASDASTTPPSQQAITLAQAEYETAEKLNPLRSSYPSALGLKIYPPLGELPQAEEALKRACVLEPDAVNYRRLAKLYVSLSRQSEVIAAATAGLQIEPNDIDLLTLRAQARLALGDVPNSLNDDRRIAAIEASPIGTIRAVTEVVDIRYAPADAALGDASLAGGDLPDAIAYYSRVRATIEAYGNEGGSPNQLRMAQNGFRPDPAADARERDLYKHVMDSLIDSLQKSGRVDDAAKAKSAEDTTMTQLGNIIATESSQ